MAVDDQSDSRPTPADGSLPSPAEAPLLVKPSWSVRSLEDLLEARRETVRNAPLREAERLERCRVEEEQARANRAEAVERAWNERYRNAWEHS